MMYQYICRFNRKFKVFIIKKNLEQMQNAFINLASKNK